MFSKYLETGDQKEGLFADETFVELAHSLLSSDESRHAGNVATMFFSSFKERRDAIDELCELTAPPPESVRRAFDSNPPSELFGISTADGGIYPRMKTDEDTLWDLPELEVNSAWKKAESKIVPAMLIVQMSLSKAHHQYFFVVPPVRAFDDLSLFVVLVSLHVRNDAYFF